MTRLRRLAAVLRRAARGCGLLALLCVAALLATALVPAHAATVRIGVLSSRSHDADPARWGLLARALQASVPEHEFIVVPLSQSELEAAVAARQVDFVLTQPAQYLLLAHRYGLTAPLATQAIEMEGQRVVALGGVVITRADRADIQSLRDLRGRTVAAVADNVFGGYLLQAHELAELGLRIPQDVQLQAVGLPMDGVIDAVLSGRADAGFVRGGFLESLARQGRLDMAGIRILNRQNLPGYPVAVSTRLYPEWPFAAMPEVEEALMRDVTAALFRIQDDAPVARGLGIRGFSVPADYQPLRNLMRALRAPPYDDAPRFTLRDVWDRYRWPMVAGAVSLALILLLLVRLAVARAQLAAGQAKLRDSEERFRRLFEETYQPMLLIEDGRFQTANRAALALLGMERLDQIVGRAPADISPEWQEDGQRSEAKAVTLIAEALQRGVTQFEWTHLRVDGQPFIAHVILTALPEAGSHRRLHVAWHDITARKRAEAELARHQEGLEQLVAQRTAELAALTETLRQRSEEQRAVFDAAPVALSQSRGGEVVMVNRAFTEMFGYGRDDLPTLSDWWVRAYPDPVYREQVRNDWQAAVQIAPSIGGRIPPQPYRLRLRDGRDATVLIGGQQIGDSVVVTFTDITLLKQAEQAEKAAREAAEAAADAKAYFLANMSHEIRTPMNAVLGMTHLALGADPSPRQRNYLEKIQASGQLLQGILNDILDFSKMEAGKLALEELPFGLDTVIDTAVAQVAGRAAAKGLELITDLPPEVPHDLVGDPLRLGQVLINYLNNAVKFTERGEIALRVRLAAREGDALTLRFEVRDTGIGIAEDQRTALFSSFQQADTSITRRYGGTGLGLAISQRLATLMGGEVGVDSTPGEGSTFWFTARLRAGAPRPRLRRPRVDWQGKRVLLVDDSDHAREVMAAQLAQMGFRVEAVASGALALEAATLAAGAGSPFDLALVDWQMPGMDGLDTVRALRAQSPAAPLRCVMVTAHDASTLQPAAREAGVHEVVVKPASPSTLLDAIARALSEGDGSRGDATDAAAPAGPPEHAPPPELAGRRALVVEDNELNQEVAVEMLRRLGLQVELAPNGAEALERVRARDYDIVMMDMQMPVMDGVTATRRIREWPDRQALPIVAMTANAMAGDRERCLEAGMNDHLPKPIDPDRLRETLVRWIGGTAGAATTVTAAVTAPASAPAPHPDADAVLAALRRLPGLDVDAALHLALGQTSLYRRLMGRFVETQGEAPAAIAQALAAGDAELARRLAHTLKGTAAQLGAQALRDAAEALEHAIRDQAPAATIAARQAALQAVFDPLLAGIGQALSAGG